MKIKDNTLKKETDVAYKTCPSYKCYWPRPNPGIFTQGQGYHHFGDHRDHEWICGTREVRGCPKTPIAKETT